MRRRITKIVCFVMLLSVMILGISSSAKAAEKRVYDDAALFTAEQTAELETRIEEVRESTKLDIVVVTTDDAIGKTSREYADDFYDNNGFGSDKKHSGVLFLIDMDNREIYISTTGYAIDLLTDYRINAILDAAYPYMPEQSYNMAAKAFLDGTEAFVEEGMVEGHYRYDTDKGRIVRPFYYYVVKLMIGMIAGAVVGLVVCTIIKAKYKAKFPKGTYSYKQNGKIRIETQRDDFLNQTVTHRRIPKQTSSGGSSRSSGSSSSGRSSVHHSSSGRSHGGGGRKF